MSIKKKSALMGGTAILALLMSASLAPAQDAPPRAERQQAPAAAEAPAASSSAPAAASPSAPAAASSATSPEATNQRLENLSPAPEASAATDTKADGKIQSGAASDSPRTEADAKTDGEVGSSAQSTDTKAKDTAAGITSGSETPREGRASTGRTDVTISTEQRTTIRSAITEVRVEPVREVDFTVTVGTAIPKRIDLRPLPPRVVEIVPEYRDYRYFLLADGRIVIVDPVDYEIVYIVTS
jgi:hypothetical protein